MLAAARTNTARQAPVLSVKACGALYLRGTAAQPCQWSQRPSQLPSAQRLLQTSARLSASLPPQDGPPMNERIQARFVQIVNQEGRLDEPMYLHDALQLIDQKTQKLVQMSPETEEQPAVCKILNKRDLYQQEKLKKKRQSARANTSKQLEINWGISKHDLKHRLKKAKEFIDKGKSVEIVLLPKKKALPATQQQATELLKEVKLAIIDMGGKESRKMDGALLGDLHLFVEKSKDPSVQQQQPQQQEEPQQEQVMAENEHVEQGERSTEQEQQPTTEETIAEAKTEEQRLVEEKQFLSSQA